MMKLIKPQIATLIIRFMPMVLLVCISLPVLAQETHTVRPSETLYGIARSYNIALDDLIKWNNLDGSNISIGQVLTVSNPDRSQRTSNTGRTHDVKAGETLFQISRMYDVTVADIRKWNNLSNDNLSVGQKLTIGSQNVTSSSQDVDQSGEPATRPSQSYHIVASGETLYGISRQYNMSISSIERLNNLNSPNLSIGQRLIVDTQRPLPSVASESYADLVVTTPKGAFVNHTLRENETLEGLLAHYHMDTKEFFSLNPNFTAEELKAGDEVELLTLATNTGANPYRVNTNIESAGNVPVTVYDPQHKGSTTTSGNLYNPDHLTAAHSSLRLGKVVYVENPNTGKGIFVQINDRVTGNYLKLSSASFNALGFAENGERTARIFDDLPE